MAPLRGKERRGKEGSVLVFWGSNIPQYIAPYVVLVRSVLCYSYSIYAIDRDATGNTPVFQRTRSRGIQHRLRSTRHTPRLPYLNTRTAQATIHQAHTTTPYLTPAQHRLRSTRHTPRLPTLAPAQHRLRSTRPHHDYPTLTPAQHRLRSTRHTPPGTLGGTAQAPSHHAPCSRPFSVEEEYPVPYGLSYSTISY